ncbi:CvpA family protein [Agaribacterium haliotis]|uniref:CvpA family protein n=1 Tax=Agaribacterium haliotis TaxID=2013869 RepID=UPI000BB59651|nr:CvpA family protein [Agaribacterium haliotis]
MNWADWVILAILAVSSLISLKRGFIKEALSLVNWVAAFFIAMAFRGVLADLLETWITAASLREMLAFAALFASTLIVGALVSNLISEFVRITGLSGTDKTIGMVFGLLRGFVVIMAILLLVPHLVPIDQDGWWQQSLLIPELLKLEGWCRGITADVAELFSKLFSKTDVI